MRNLLIFWLLKHAVSLVSQVSRFSQLGFLCATALIPGSLFGLMTFSHKIGLYDVQGPVPVVKNVFIPPDSEEGGLAVALEDAMPLLSFLAPVCYITI